MGRQLEKGYLKDKSGRILARVEMTKNQIFKLNLKIKIISLICEWKRE